MKTAKYLFIFSSIASSALFGESIVSTSGSWSSPSTWKDSAVPSTSSSSQLDFLRFSSSGLNLNVDSTQYVNTVDVGANDNTTINIAAGNTLYLTGYTVEGTYNSSVIYADSQNQNITFSGDGTLRFDISGQKNIVRGNVVFDVETSATDSLFFSDKGTVTFKKDFTSTNQISVGGTWNFIIDEGVNFSLSRGFNLWGDTGSFTLKKGATVESKAGAQFYNGDISGNIICKGAENYDANRYAFKSINAVYNATATITQTEGGHLRSILGGNITSSAAAGKLSFESKLSINTGATITLNSSNAFKTEGASTQGESNFYLMNQQIVGTHPNRDETLTESNVNFILNADNDFGTFFFYGASVLSMTTNGNSVNIGKFDVVPDSSGSVSAYFTDLVDFTVKINSLDNITCFEDGDSIRAENVFFGSEDSKDFAYILEDTQNGGWWINATAAVPEPSDCAAVFGVFALALAAALKRKNK